MSNFFYNNTFCPKCHHLAGITNTHHRENNDFVNCRFWTKDITFFLCPHCVHSWTDEFEREIYYSDPYPME